MHKEGKIIESVIVEAEESVENEYYKAINDGLFSVDVDNYPITIEDVL